MLVIIAGYGTVGKFILDSFVEEEADITVIERDPKKIEELNQTYDVLPIQGGMLSHYVLRHANVAASDLFIACSSSDSVNILACQLAKRLGARHCVARVYSEEIFPIDIEELEKHLGVDWLVSPNRLTGFKLASSLFESEHIRLDSYFANKMEMAKLTVTPESNLNHKKVHKVFKSNKLYVVAVYKDGKNVLTPGNLSDKTLSLSDEIIVSGVKNKLIDIISEIYSKKFKRARKIYIAGTSHSALSVLHFLGKHRKDTVLLEKDIDLAQKIKTSFHDIQVLNIDPAQYSQIKQAKLETNGIFICGSEDDADNLTYALNAEELGIKHIVPIVHGIDKMRFFKRLKYNKIICPSVLAGQEIFRYFDENIKKDFDLIQGSKAKAIIKEIEPQSEWNNQSIDTINKTNEDLRPIAVWRAGHIYLPHDKALTSLLVEDRVLVSSLSGNEKALLKLLS